jgi:hypothetical protein
MMRLYPPLHCQILQQIGGICQTFTLSGCPAYPLLSAKVAQHLIKDFNVGVLTSRVGALNPHQVPPQNTHPQLVAEGRLPCKLVGGGSILLCRSPLLGNLGVHPIDCH